MTNEEQADMLQEILDHGATIGQIAPYKVAIKRKIRELIYGGRPLSEYEDTTFRERRI